MRQVGWGAVGRSWVGWGVLILHNSEAKRKRSKMRVGLRMGGVRVRGRCHSWGWRHGGGGVCRTDGLVGGGRVGGVGGGVGSGVGCTGGLVGGRVVGGGVGGGVGCTGGLVGGEVEHEVACGVDVQIRSSS